MKNNLNSLPDILKEKGIRPSHQRMVIMEYLILNRNHPTVEMIYNDLHRSLPTLSKTTVYNTLNLFVEHNLVRVLSLDDNKSRYDIDVGNHGHFKCSSCNSIFDFPVNIEDLTHNQLDNFKINEESVFLKGLCPDCINN